ncbi:MAG: phage portal protein [Deltaproteobacteria bacterium]|nr:phage portal protein [Deltaproteobacteria bacterium]MBW2124216.1 phage portal protein [Deltaproteobacteria bacterium]
MPNWKFWQRKKKHKGFRGFDAAAINRLLNDWVTTSKSIDQDLKNGVLKILRARSRDLCQNNDYGRKFLNLLATNVVGPNGIRLQSKVYRPPNSRGKVVLDGPANEQIERAWRKWCKKGNCTVDGQLGFVDVQKLIIKTAGRDGEALIRIVRNFPNEFGFAIQILDPARLDEDKNDNRQNITLGVQKDEWGRPINYYIVSQDAVDGYYESIVYDHEILPAEEIIHLYIIEHPGQSRGVPWPITALKRLHMLGNYEESELVASRIAAAKMGFFINPDGSLYPGDDTDSLGNVVTEVSPGKFEQLPAGWDFKAFDVDHPTTAFEDFIKAILKGAAAGLNVSYASLANDMADANYSSTRHATLEERDHWMSLQRWFIENFINPIFEEWLRMVLLKKVLNLPAEAYERWNSPIWQPRRWSWIDPLKDVKASETAIAMGINSRTRIASEQGHDFDDIIEELAREKEKAQELGLDLEAKKPQTQGVKSNGFLGITPVRQSGGKALP